MVRVITREVIEAHLRCKFKGHLKLSGEQGPNMSYELLSREQAERVHLKAVDKLLARHAKAVVDRKVLLTPAQLKGGASLILDAIWDDAGFVLSFDGLERVEGASTLGDFHYIPVLFFGNERIRQAHRHLLGLFGLLLGDIQGRQPDTGLVVHGTDARVTTVSLARGTRRMGQLFTELQVASQSEAAPRLALNDHCPLCEFRDRCHVNNRRRPQPAAWNERARDPAAE